MKRLIYLLPAVLMLSLFACNSPKNNIALVEKGISKKLNDRRDENISKVVYKLHFNLPATKAEPVWGNEEIAFDIKFPEEDIILDFQNDKGNLRKVLVNGKKIKNYNFVNGHIILPHKAFHKGHNLVSTEFIASNFSLNRSTDYLYTLFVPDKASTAFPCFDQPDIKGQFILILDIPRDWVAVSNGQQTSMENMGPFTQYVFGQTKPISTYLFAFAAGKFKVIKRTIKGHTLTLYHRETDSLLVKQNLDDIFLLQADAINWMEQYTGLKYPFQKFDFVLLPSFQFSGMEHPGDVFYRSEKMFLDKSATLSQKLERARLIAHETAHMWFGDLVTMKWFNDVWLKEVFASFMAGKMVNPSFPTFNHNLLFLTDNFPKAYAVDRTQGTNAIEQPLENLNMAGTLYGAIIYHKAPIIMMQLEEMIGAEKFRKGLTEYLRKFAYSNANWDDLVDILNSKTKKDLRKWSDVWVKQAGMPVYKLTYIKDLVYIDEFDMQQKLRFWPQNVDMYKVENEKYGVKIVFDDKQQYQFPIKKQPDLLFLNGNGKVYGYQQLDDKNKTFLLSSQVFRMPVITRTAIYIDLWEDMQNKNTLPQELRKIFPYFIKHETAEPSINLLLSYYQKLFWRFTLPDNRMALARKMEPLLWKKMEEATTLSLKSSYYKTYVKTAITKGGIEKLYSVWQKKIKIKGLSLSVANYTTLAYELAVRRALPQGKTIPDDILKKQLQRITNPDRKKEMAFIIPALNKNPAVRAEFFESLKIPLNRQHQQWVIKAVTYLNHPLVAIFSEKFILPSMEMLQGIQKTSDVFFPKSWLDAAFYGYNSKHAAAVIKKYLDKNHDLNKKLRQKILQAADPVLRSANILFNETSMIGFKHTKE